MLLVMQVSLKPNLVAKFEKERSSIPFSNIGVYCTKMKIIIIFCLFSLLPPHNTHTQDKVREYIGFHNLFHRSIKELASTISMQQREYEHQSLPNVHSNPSSVIYQLNSVSAMNYYKRGIVIFFLNIAIKIGNNACKTPSTDSGLWKMLNKHKII